MDSGCQRRHCRVLEPTVSGLCAHSSYLSFILMQYSRDPQETSTPNRQPKPGRRALTYWMSVALTLFVLTSTSMRVSADGTSPWGSDFGGSFVTSVPACTLACSPRLRQCSMYAVGRVPRRYIAVKYMAYGYRRVYSTSTCEMTVCGLGRGLCGP